jgi:hypothetical protein
MTKRRKKTMATKPPQQMERAPITKIRSTWQRIEGPEIPGAIASAWFVRSVSDGTLSLCVADEPQIGWHLSISFRDHKGFLTRYPQWDEIADARDQFLPNDLSFVMHLPTTEEYVALHDTTFHIHQFNEVQS